jgi:hypothetical protein
MMTRIRMIGLAVVAVLSVMALAATSASALNNENPVLVKSNGEAASGVSVTGKAAKVSFLESSALGNGKVECETETSVGTLTTTLTGNGMTNGTGTVTFKKCKTAAGECQNAGEGTKEIKNTVSILLVWEGKENTKTLAVLLSILPYAGRPGVTGNNQVSFLCSTKLVDVQGSFIALTNRVVNELFTTLKLLAKQVSLGHQEDLTYTENGVSTTNTLWSREEAGAFALASENVENEETYSTSVKVIEN